MKLKKLSKIGLLLLALHSVIVLILGFIDTVDAFKTGSSGFALIPIVTIDFPVAIFFAFLTKIFGLSFAKFPRSILTNQALFIIPFLVFGGAQWYLIGSLISKVKDYLKDWHD